MNGTYKILFLDVARNLPLRGVCVASRLPVASLPLCGYQPSQRTSLMDPVSSVTRQIAAFEISSKTAASSSSNPAAPTLQSKKPHQTNVSRLLTKFGAPNPFPDVTNKSTLPSSVRQGTQPSKQPRSHLSIDIGRYDGGLEIDNDKRGAEVYGKAAEELALDSSVSQYVASFPKTRNQTQYPPHLGNIRHGIGT